jgi:hypothetical protein
MQAEIKGKEQIQHIQNILSERAKMNQWWAYSRYLTFDIISCVSMYSSALKISISIFKRTF